VAKLIGTAGHVDHGKTSLIRALTGIDADRLPEEKARGMTLDIGFAYLDLPEVGRVSIVDVPGHERLVHNMLVGAYGIDVGLLCIAADEGVKPQTTEHLAILNLLPVSKLVVALTRVDLADVDTQSLVRLQIEDLLAETRFQSAPIMGVSAVTLEGLDELKSTLQRLLVGGDEPTDGSWMLPIDRVMTVKGHGVVVTGTLFRGHFKVGDAAVLMPGERSVRIRAIHTHGEPTERAERGKRTALNLSGVDKQDLRRGMIVGAPGSVFETMTFDAKMKWLEPPKQGLRVRVSAGTEEVMARVFLKENEPEMAQFRLESVLACAKGQPVIIRRFSPQELLGGGVIITPQASRKRRAAAVEGETVEEMVLGVVDQAAGGISTDEVARRLGRSLQDLGTPFENLIAAKQIVGFAGTWVTTERVREIFQDLQEALLRVHALTPTVATVPCEKVVAEMGLSWAGKTLDRLGAAMAAAGKIQAEGPRWKHPEFEIQLSPKQSQLLSRVEAELDKGGVNPPLPLDVARTIGVPPMAVDEVLSLGINARRVVKLDENVFYTKAQIEEIKAKSRTTFSGRRFTAAEFRDALGTSRKYAIPLLEHLDSTGFTLRQQDTRVLRESAK
jgi:selenocysteine-specific elongation factor